MNNVCYVIDENNVDQLLTSIYSLILNGDVEQLCVNVVAVNCIDIVQTKIGLEFSNSGSIFNIVNAGEQFSMWSSSISYITTAMFHRLELHKYLDVDKVLYVDADVIFVGSIRELIDVDLGRSFAAVVRDRNARHAMFNSGVMLLNLAKIRASSDYAARIDEVYKLTNGRTSDQSILNLVFEQDVIYVDTVYNFMLSIASEVNLREFAAVNGILAADVRVLHFAGADKPWSTMVTGTAIYNMYSARAVDVDVQAKLLKLYIGR